MNKLEFKNYINSLKKQRDEAFDKNDRKKAGNINVTIKFLETASNSLKEEEDVDLNLIKSLLVLKKTNHAVLAEGYLDLGNEDLMDNELNEIATMEEVEEYLDKFLA